MKTFLILNLFICGCAHGIESPDVESSMEISPPAQISTPENEVSGPTRNCTVTTRWVDNCRMDIIRCEDGFFDIDTRCYPTGIFRMPWQWLPDPPPYHQNDKNK
jgi:hypothetical protein